MSEYVVVSVYDAPNGTRIVHTWGPHPTREKAIAARRRMKRQDERREDRPVGRLTYSTCEILGDEPPR